MKQHILLFQDVQTEFKYEPVVHHKICPTVVCIHHVHTAEPVCETVVGTDLGCVHTTNAAIAIVQLK